MAHFRTAVKNPGPASVSGTVRSAIGLAAAVVKRHGVARDVTSLRLRPAPGNSSGSRIKVPVITIGRGCVRWVIPGTRGNNIVRRASDYECRHANDFSLCAQVSSVGQANQWCNGPECRRALGILSQLPGKHATVRTACCKDVIGIDTQLALDKINQGNNESNVICLALSPRAGIFLDGCT